VAAVLGNDTSKAVRQRLKARLDQKRSVGLTAISPKFAALEVCSPAPRPCAVHTLTQHIALSPSAWVVCARLGAFCTCFMPVCILHAAYALALHLTGLRLAATNHRARAHTKQVLKYGDTLDLAFFRDVLKMRTFDEEALAEVQAVVEEYVRADSEARSVGQVARQACSVWGRRTGGQVSGTVDQALYQLQLCMGQGCCSFWGVGGRERAVQLQVSKPCTC